MTKRESAQLKALEAALIRWLRSQGVLKRRPPKDWTVWSINQRTSSRDAPLNAVLTPEQMLAVRMYMKTCQVFAWPETERVLALDLEKWVEQTTRLRDSVENFASELQQQLQGVLLLRHPRTTTRRMRRQLAMAKTAIKQLSNVTEDVEKRLDLRPFRLPLLRRLAISRSRSNLPLHVYTELLRRVGFSAAERARITGITKRSDDESTRKQALDNMRRAVSRRKRHA